MKVLALFSLFVIVSCAHNRGPASLNGQPVAYDEMALGNIKASAVKSIEKQDVCFDITLKMKGVPQREAQASNWTVAWVDKESKYHLLSLNQRDPASAPQGGTKVVPYGAYEEWTNTFKTCAPKARSGDVQSLILTPKELTYREAEGMKLEWN
jgi:hypothetical protein